MKTKAADAVPRGLRQVLRDTPRQLTLLTTGLGVLCLLLGLVYACALLRDSESIGGLQTRTTEVSATSDLYYELNDMDAQAANALLVGYHPADPTLVPASVNAQSSTTAYQHDRSAADADLARIATNPALTTKAEKLLDDLGSYESLIAQALYMDQGAQNQNPASPPTAALSAYTDASRLLHTTLLPESLQITDTDSAAVDTSYAGEHSTAALLGYLILGLALLTAAGLYLGNRYHARRFRRRVSYLVPGIAVVLALGAFGLTTQLNEASHLHLAKQEAYDSVNALIRAKAVSDDANADESRWLLEGRDPALQASFFQKAEAVASAPGSYYSALSDAISSERLDAAANTVDNVKIGGYLGTELHNITFAGEARAASETAVAFNAYIQDDAVIRADVAKGDLAGAVALDIGTVPGQSNYAFNLYNVALGTVIQINESAFAAGISAGHADADSAAWAAGITSELLLLGLITRTGYLRLREYR